MKLTFWYLKWERSRKSIKYGLPEPPTFFESIITWIVTKYPCLYQYCENQLVIQLHHHQACTTIHKHKYFIWKVKPVIEIKSNICSSSSCHAQMFSCINLKSYPCHCSPFWDSHPMHCVHIFCDFPFKYHNYTGVLLTIGTDLHAVIYLATIS